MKRGRFGGTGKVPLIVLYGLILLFLSFSVLWRDNEKNEDRLTVACGNDTAGMLVRYVLEETGGETRNLGLDYVDIGDCCSSNAQFAFASGDVDIAVVCPDALEALQEDGTEYVRIGVVTRDSNVLVRTDTSQDVPERVGYMNQRTEQKEALERYYHGTVDLEPMFSTGLVYALENDSIDRAVLDASIALGAGYDIETISDNMPTALLIARPQLEDSPQLKHFIKAYNRMVSSLSDEDQLWAVLRTVLSDTDETEKEEVLTEWKRMNVKIRRIG